MPTAIINILKGHDRQKLKQIIRETTDAMHKVLSAPKERLMIWINEIDQDLWGLAGNPASDISDFETRKSLEIPFVQMTLMKGRPLEQFHKIMDEISEIIARNLEINKSQVRVHIANAEPELWAIGGVPASILRAKELEARKTEMAK
ncbi:tautomerase family protein [Pseudaquidulcibacter saccharophilus]|uniref:tautomerase family protein n=1 Tax=Pseudaquidulcibacter saccharophilus TaxID=2831900 RepID=UPI001EFF10CD|nr:tautomerase family protein [Pseudaquidulcibacter saccharophilus]